MTPPTPPSTTQGGSNFTPTTVATGSTLAGATVGLVIWVLATYVFHGAVPGPIESFTDIALPAGMTGFSAWFVHRQARKSK